MAKQEEELTMEMKLRRLNVLKRDLEGAKSERDQKIGERNSLLSRLNQQFGIKNLEAGHKEIKNIEDKLTTRSRRIDESFRILQRDYDL